MSDLSGAPVLVVHELHVPPAGGWLADLWLSTMTLPAIGPATLTVGDLSLVGAVTQADFDDHPIGGARPRVTVEGGAGWNVPLSRAGIYQSPSGVRLSTVLSDLAGLVGEAVDLPPDLLLPPDFRWPASTAAEIVTGGSVLSGLVVLGAIPTWRVDPSTGHTVFTPWPTLGPADGIGRVLRRNLARGRRTVGLDTRVAAFLPGGSVEGVTTRRLRLHETARMLEAEVFAT